MSRDVQKKESLAKVWLASKKPTKKEALQTDIKATVEESLDEMSPHGRLDLPAYGNLLLGVSRIYSRQLKYFYEDLEQTCAKIGMAHDIVLA